MLKVHLRLLVIAAILLAPQPGTAQERQDTATPPAPALTAAQAQHALEVLRDDGKRARLIETLQAVATASTPAVAPAPPQAADNLGVQLLVQVSDWLGDVSSELAIAARTVSDFPLVWRWLVHLTTDPNARNFLLDTAWKLALVIACALAAEWIIRRVVRRTISALNRYVPARTRAATDRGRAAASGGAVPLDGDHDVHRRHASLVYTWQLIVRLPFVLARLVLDLLPVASFAGVGNLLLATEIGSE